MIIARAAFGLVYLPTPFEREIAGSPSRQPERIARVFFGTMKDTGTCGRVAGSICPDGVLFYAASFFSFSRKLKRGNYPFFIF